MHWTAGCHSTCPPRTPSSSATTAASRTSSRRSTRRSTRWGGDTGGLWRWWSSVGLFLTLRQQHLLISFIKISSFIKSGLCGYFLTSVYPFTSLLWYDKDKLEELPRINEQFLASSSEGNFVMRSSLWMLLMCWAVPYSCFSIHSAPRPNFHHKGQLEWQGRINEQVFALLSEDSFIKIPSLSQVHGCFLLVFLHSLLSYAIIRIS